METLPDADFAHLRGLVEQRLAETWNRMDGAAFAELFAEDAVFVDIKANRDDGRAAIAVRHVQLFETVFRGTTVEYRLVDAAMVAPGLALGHIRASVNQGAGTLETLASALFRRRDDADWQLQMFHNTEISRY
jgi:uncharacterized protein (TIGR02246 family)